MRISRVSYTQLKNTGNYENIRVEAEVVLEEDESPKLALRKARKFVAKALGLSPSEEELAAARELLEEWNEEDC